ncbi:MAG TPA: lysylphosphatidylglycerol synthase transmembrane domain-containing protein [Stellaceae bacterium]|nr:lysylphosphatidylglycerol synthase transmembrane domain-containing protein [Stellaceae bacterium]
MMKLARYGAGLVLLAALFYFRVIDLDELRKALAHPGLLALAWALCLATIPIAGLRWHILLRSQGLDLHLHLWQTIRIVAVGAFFATFLPGAAGGDLVRGVYIYQASHGRRTGALLSIFIDRLIGLTAFVVFGVVATLTRPWQSYGVFEYGIFGFAFLFIAGIVVLFLFGHRIARLVNHRFAGRSHRVAAIIDDAGKALHQYSRQWRSVLLCFGISLVIVFMVAFVVVVIADASEFGGLTPVEYGIAGVYAMIANSLPFTPGGLGIGEGAFASACIALEPSVTGIPYGTIFLVLRCVTVLSTLPGLFAYLFYPQRASLLAPAKASS